MSGVEPDTIYDFIEFTCQKIGDALETDRKMGKSTSNYGLKKLLLSMIDLREEHKKQVIKLGKMGNLCDFFNYGGESRRGKETFFLEISFFDAMEYLDFLTMTIKREDEFSRLYTYLKSIARIPDVKILFQQLADEEKKQRVWALDRYELEILCRDL
jgi:rubrerythrin